MKIGGVVLCGGQSSRMGKPKAWLPFGDELMLSRICRILADAVDPLVVVAAQDQDVPLLPPRIRIVRDREKGRGPLQGLAAGLSALKDEAAAIFLSSCDVPFLHSSFVRRMIDLLGEKAICVPEVDGRHHPLAAVYRVAILPHVEELLGKNRSRPGFLFETCPTRFVSRLELSDIDPDLKSLRNLNTPEEYAQALEDLASPTLK